VRGSAAWHHRHRLLRSRHHLQLLATATSTLDQARGGAVSATTRRRCHSSRRPRSPLVCRPAAAPRAARRSSSTRARCEWWQCVTFGRGGHTPRVRRSVAAKAAPLPRTVSEHAGQELALAVRQGLPQSCMHMQSANYCGGRALRHSAYLHDGCNEGVRRSTVGCGWHLRTHHVNTTR